MSSIMDRLRNVEGAGFSGRVRQGKGSGRQSGQCERRTPDLQGPLNRSPSTPEMTGERPAASPCRWHLATAFRVAAGLLVIAAAFVVWKMWTGKTQSRSANGRQLAALRADVRGAGEEANQAPPQKPGLRVFHTVQTPASPDQPDITPPAGPEKPDVRLSSVADTPGFGGEKAPDNARGEALPESAGQTSSPKERPAAPGQDSQEDTVTASLAEAPAREILTPQEDKTTKALLLSLKVSGVYKDADGYVALINGREFQEGDRIGRIEIMRIASERMTFAYKGKRYHLPLR